MANPSILRHPSKCWQVLSNINGSICCSTFVNEQQAQASFAATVWSVVLLNPQGSVVAQRSGYLDLGGRGLKKILQVARAGQELCDSPSSLNASDTSSAGGRLFRWALGSADDASVTDSDGLGGASFGGATASAPCSAGVAGSSLEAVVLNVYWQRGARLDETGRLSRSQAGLPWQRKLLKDVLGVYHASVQVYGVEYTFGNSEAPSGRRVGNASSAIFAHEPRRAGAHNVFKEAVPIGVTTLSAGDVELCVRRLAESEFTVGSYNRIYHNCVDFCKRLAAGLGAEDVPAWVHRGASMARTLGGLSAAGGGFFNCGQVAMAKDQEAAEEIEIAV